MSGVDWKSDILLQKHAEQDELLGPTNFLLDNL